MADLIDTTGPWGLIFLVGMFGTLIFYVVTHRIRVRSLHQREDGMFIWTEWYGERRSSRLDPRLPGGEWYSDSDGNQPHLK